MRFDNIYQLVVCKTVRVNIQMLVKEARIEERSKLGGTEVCEVCLIFGRRIAAATT